MTKYDDYSQDQLTEHLSNYLINHWSYSGVRVFRRNEKAFERSYIFGIRDEGKGETGLTGEIYHKCLEEYFYRKLETSKEMPFAEIVKLAQKIADDVPMVFIEPSKKLDKAQIKMEAEKNVNKLLTNFYAEKQFYDDDIKQVLFIEWEFQEFVTIAGEDIALPLRGKPDLVYINFSDELCVDDHKSKDKYTPAEDVDLRLSEQNTIYKKLIDTYIANGRMDRKLIKKFPKILEGVKHFYYHENKYTKNKDGTHQIRRIPMNMEPQTIDLYEKFLYEGIARMLKAVSDPDYVYLPNPDDMFEEAGDIMSFWIKSKIEDAATYERLTDQQKKLLKKRKEKSIQIGLDTIPKTIIERALKPQNFVTFNLKDMEAVMNPQQRIESRLRYFNLLCKVAKTVPGYQSTVYLLQVGAGTRIAQIMRCEMDIANSLGAENVRIGQNLVRVDGESYVSVEVNKPKTERTYPSRPAMVGNAIPIGKSNFGDEVAWDLDNQSTPHLMISGASGSGKSVTIKSILQYAEDAGYDVTVLDPKREFDDSIKEQEDIEKFIEGLVVEMDMIFKKHKEPRMHIVIFDEAADALMRETKKRYIYEEREEMIRNKMKYSQVRVEDPKFKPLSQNILILSQKARSAGIHLLLAAQRFSTKILTGDVKANFTLRMAMTCAKEVDSQVMIDETGAEKLNGYGDGLIVSPEYAQPVRIQCYK